MKTDLATFEQYYTKLRTVLALRTSGKTFREIGLQFGVSYVRANQVYRRAMFLSRWWGCEGHIPTAAEVAIILAKQSIAKAYPNEDPPDTSQLSLLVTQGQLRINSKGQVVLRKSKQLFLTTSEFKRLKEALGLTT